jgi:RnfABCDGE-type electron transport complex G subunit
MDKKEILKITINLIVIYVIGGVLLAAVYAKTSPIIWQNNKEDKEAALKAMMPIDLAINAPASAEEDIKEALKGASDIEENQADGGLIITAKTDYYRAHLKKVLKEVKSAGATNVAQNSEFTPMKAGDWHPTEHHTAEFFDVKDKEGNPHGYIVETMHKGYGSYPDLYVTLNNDLVVQKLEVLSHGETPGLGDEIMTDWFRNQFKGKDLDHLVVIKGETPDKIQAITGATISSRAVTNAVREAIEMIQKRESGEAAPMEGGEVHGAAAGESEGH